MSELFFTDSPNHLCSPLWSMASTFIGQPRIFNLNTLFNLIFLYLSWLFILPQLFCELSFCPQFWKCWKVVTDRLLSASPSGHFDVCHCVPGLLFPLQSSWASPPWNCGSVTTICISGNNSCEQEIQIQNPCEILLRTSNVRYMITFRDSFRSTNKEKLQRNQNILLGYFWKAVSDFLLDYEN